MKRAAREPRKLAEQMEASLADPDTADDDLG